MPSMHTFTFKSVDSIDLKLNVYVSESTSNDKPSVLFFHGGGLVSYDRTSIAPHIVQACLLRGWPLISADYRLLPQVTAEELLEDVRDAYRFVDEQLRPRLGIQSEQSSRGPRGGIIVAGTSAGGFLATLSATMTPTPLAVFDIYGIPTFQSFFFHSNTTYPTPPIHISQIAHHLNRPITTGSTPSSEAFSLDCLLDDCSRNPNYNGSVGEDEEGSKDAEVTAEGLQLWGAPYLYDYFVQEGFYARVFKEIEETQFAEWKAGGKEWPRTIIIHGDADEDVPLNLSVEFAEKHGPDVVQLIIVNGKGHFYDEGMFLGDPGLKEFEEAWKVLDDIVVSSR